MGNMHTLGIGMGGLWLQTWVLERSLEWFLEWPLERVSRTASGTWFLKWPLERFLEWPLEWFLDWVLGQLLLWLWAHDLSFTFNVEPLKVILEGLGSLQSLLAGCS